jgi:sulfofructose kinase
MNKKEYDVLGLGTVAVDDLLYVPAYPLSDSKIQVERIERQPGGLTGTALAAAARLGAKCAYAGVLGMDDLSEFILDSFKRQGVDVTHLKKQPDARPYHSTIIVDTTHKTRTIFFDLSGAIGADPHWPAEEVILSSRVLFVDQTGVPGMIRAAGIARRAGIPIVADIELKDLPGMPELMALVDHLILPFQFAGEVTGKTDPAAALKALWTADRDTVAVTDGAKGCWYLTRSLPGQVCHQPAFQVQVVDTTGCGDVFHGAYAAALAEGMAITERIKFASAVAALKVTRPGGQAGIPDRFKVEKYMKEHI